MKKFDFMENDTETPPDQDAFNSDGVTKPRPQLNPEHDVATRSRSTLVLFIIMVAVGLLAFSGQGIGLHSLVKYEEDKLQFASEREIWEAEKKQREITFSEWKKMNDRLQAELQEKQKHLNSLPEKIKPLEDQYSKAVAQAEAVQTRLGQLQKAAEDAVAAKQLADRNKQDALEKHQELTTKISETETRRDSISTEIQNLTTQRDTTAASLKSNDATLKQYTDQLETLRSDIKKFDSELLKRREELLRVNGNLLAASNELAKLRADKDRASAEHSKMEELVSQKVSLEAAVGELQKAKDQLDARLATGDAKLRKMLKDYYTATKRVADIKVTDEALETLKKEKTQLDTALPSLQSQRTETEKKIKELQETKKKLAGEVTDFEAKERELRDKEAELARIKKDLRESQSEKNRYNGEILTLKTETANLEKEYSKKSKELQLLIQKLDAKRKQAEANTPDNKSDESSKDAPDEKPKDDSNVNSTNTGE